MKYKDILCGIDEAGRGCIAGDLVVSGVVLYEGIDIQGLNDSKKISPKKREIIYEQIISNSVYKIVQIKSKQIDKVGLSECIKQAILEIIEYMQSSIDANVDYLMDGNCTFGIDEIRCKIKADADTLQVMAASILSKVTKDRQMISLHNGFSDKYVKYNFIKNKGYGTKEHIKAIKEYGLSDEHRASFQIKSLNK